MGTKRPLYIHVGCRKSGTSFLQAAIQESRKGLDEQGLVLPLVDRGGHVTKVLMPLTSFRGDEAPASVRRALSDLAVMLERAEGSRLLLTLEDLAELDAYRASLLVDALEAFEVHVVITARDWARQIPSEWQQCVKERLLVPYADFARAIRERGPDAALYLARQDVPGIAARWGASLPAERVHVVAVPPSGSDPMRLFELFAQVVDIDPETLRTAGGRNPSLGYEQAETLRRVNVALGDRLTDLRREYRWAVRHLIYRGALLGQEGRSLRLPAAFEQWCHEVTAAQVRELTARGYDLVGSPQDLVSTEGGETEDFAEVTDAQVAAVAVQALADIAVLRDRERQDARKTTLAQRDQASGAPAPAGTEDRGRRALPSGPRRVAGGVRRRLRDWRTR